MNRRAFLFASAASAAIGTPTGAASRLHVIYVGGLDCPPCLRWRASYEARWMASPERRRVTFTEIEPPHLRDAYQERHWPGELRQVLAQVPRKSGTPRFLIVKDGRVVSNELGGSKWLNTMAHLRKILGE
jgi:hypothetical protein